MLRLMRRWPHSGSIPSTRHSLGVGSALKVSKWLFSSVGFESYSLHCALVLLGDVTSEALFARCGVFRHVLTRKETAYACITQCCVATGFCCFVLSYTVPSELQHPLWHPGAWLRNAAAWLAIQLLPLWLQLSPTPPSHGHAVRLQLPAAHEACRYSKSDSNSNSM